MQQIMPLNVKKPKKSHTRLCNKNRYSKPYGINQKFIEFNYRRLIVAVLNSHDKKSDAFEFFFHKLNKNIKEILLEKLTNECQNNDIRELAINYKKKQEGIKKDINFLYKKYINQRFLSQNRNDYYTQKTLRQFTNNIKNDETKELFLTKLSIECSTLSISQIIKRPLNEIIISETSSSIKRSSTILLSEHSLSSRALTHANQLENYILLKFSTKNLHQAEESNIKTRKQIKCFLSNYFENKKVTNKLEILNHLAVSLDYDIQDIANDLIEKINKTSLN